MHIDHFVPQALREDLKAEYTNLLYLCPACNGLKKALLLPDPCSVALGKCLKVSKNGQIEAINGNGEGKRLIDVLALDTPAATTRRRIIIGTLLSLAESDWLKFVEWMRYPENLPNLADHRLTPTHNSKPEGVAQSYYARKNRGDLPEVY